MTEYFINSTNEEDYYTSMWSLGLATHRKYGYDIRFRFAHHTVLVVEDKTGNKVYATYVLRLNSRKL